MKKLPILLTGATGAIGHALALALAGKGENLILACRSKSKADALRADIRNATGREVEFVSLDLASSQSLDECIAELSGRELAGIINVAGVMCRDYQKLPGGEEMTMGVNYRATLRLNKSLMDNIVDGGTMVFTTSLTRFLGRKEGYSLDVSKENFSQLGTYGLSKKALTDFALRLAKENPRIRIVCFDPGIVDTGMISMHRWFDPLADIFFRPFIRKPSEGAEPALRAYYGTATGCIYTRRHIRRH